MAESLISSVAPVISGTPTLLPLSTGILNETRISPSLDLLDTGSGHGLMSNGSSNSGRKGRLLRDPSTGQITPVTATIVFLEVVALGLLFVLLAFVLVKRPQGLVK